MVVDLFLVYQFVRRLATPFNKWEAYEQGIIDDKGNILIKKKDRDAKQRKAFGVFDVMVTNMKKLLAKVPGGSSRLASYAAALYLIKEHKAFTDESQLDTLTEEQINESIDLFCIGYNHYTTLSEDVNGFFDEIDEKLKASDDMGVWVKDFQKSDAPQFKGKSQKKRQQMAVAAKLDAMNEARKPQPPKWKKAGPNGEKEITFPTGRRFKIEKQLDEDERHKGDWKVMEWDKRSRDWEWHETYSPQWYAKEKVMELGKYDSKGKKVTESATNMRALKLISKIKKSGVVKSGSMSKEGSNKVDTTPEIEEDAPANNVSGGNIAGMDGGHMSKAGQKKWTSGNKSDKKKRLRDIMGDKI